MLFIIFIYYFPHYALICIILLICFQFLGVGTVLDRSFLLPSAAVLACDYAPLTHWLPHIPPCRVFSPSFTFVLLFLWEFFLDSRLIWKCCVYFPRAWRIPCCSFSIDFKFDTIMVTEPTLKGLKSFNLVWVYFMSQDVGHDLGPKPSSCPGLSGVSCIHGLHRSLAWGLGI